MSINKYIFDDGSLESKVLQHDIPDAQVFKVKPYAKLDTWLAEILEEDDNIKFVYLHFCQGDLIKQDKDIRTEIATALHNYPYLRIILRYEQMDKPSIERRAANLGINVSDKIQVIIPTTEDYDPNSKEDLVKITLEGNKNKIKLIEYNKEKAQDYGKYTVGGNDSFDKKREEFKDKRRRKKNDQ